MRPVAEVLEYHGNPLDDGDPQLRGIFPLHPRAGHPSDTGHPVGHDIGIDLQQRGAQPDLRDVDDLIPGHQPGPDDHH